MVFSEAFFPSARRLFHHRMRLPIADAHYAMGFAFLHEATGNPAYLEKAVHFLNVLKETRSPGFKEYCWGYPFDWVTRNGVIKAHTPLITTTPYVFEAFLHVHQLQPREEWKNILESIVRHAATDIKDSDGSDGANTCSYMPGGEADVVNASAYRAAMLVSAAKFFDDDELLKIAERQREFRFDSAKCRRFLALRQGRGARFRGPFPHLFCDEGAGKNPLTSPGKRGSWTL